MRPGGPLPPGERPGFRASLDLLELRPFRWLLISNTAFFLAMGSQMIARSLIALELTDSARQLALIGVAVGLPMVLFSPLGGALADRIERRGLIIVGQVAIVVSECTVLILYVTETLEFWHLTVAATLMGSIFPFSMPARQAITANVVGIGRITRAMALNMGMMNATRIVGPSMAGVLIAFIGISGALAVGTGLYIVALVCMFKVDRSVPLVREPRPVFDDMIEGFRYVGREPQVMAMLLYGIIPMLVLMPFQQFLVVFARDVWGAIPLPWGEASYEVGLGVMQAVSGIGGLAGSLWLAASGDTPHRRRPMILCLLGFAIFLIGFSWTPIFWLALPPLLIAGMLSSIFQTLNNATIQVLIPDSVRGRVSSFMMMSFGVTPLGALPMGIAMDNYGAPTAITGAALIMIVIAIAFSWGSRSIRELDGNVRQALEEAAELEAPDPSPEPARTRG
jgi:MFS family permease